MSNVSISTSIAAKKSQHVLLTTILMKKLQNNAKDLHIRVATTGTNATSHLILRYKSQQIQSLQPSQKMIFLRYWE